MRPAQVEEKTAGESAPCRRAHRARKGQEERSLREKGPHGKTASMSRPSRVFSAVLLALGTASVALSQGPAPAPRPAQPPVERSPEEVVRRKQAIIKADNEEITVGEVEDFLNAQPPM